ncbi:hypothetical protein [Cupriavidus sp. USMAA2-4]|uniref:hypothetical protein n=1 Tax=Cupriavidus sp. USMAA2-4 TaxID=876364 RepID=UPI0012F4AEB8|nr:hypothetical protein [Cupriavidus sp. USMAA2-4]
MHTFNVPNLPAPAAKAAIAALTLYGFQVLANWQDNGVAVRVRCCMPEAHIAAAEFAKILPGGSSVRVEDALIT